MRFLQNKKIIGGVCIAVAAVFAFVILPGVYKSKDRTTQICALTTNVFAGEQITDSMIQMIEVGSYGLSDKIIKDKSKIVGKFAKISILKSDLLFEEKFADYMADERLDAIMEDNKLLVSVTMATTAAGVANHIQKGDFVSIACFKSASVGYDSSVDIDPELKGLQVYSVKNIKTVDLSEIEQSGDSKEDIIASTITLIVNESQAQKLILAEYSGKLHVIFEKRGTGI